MALSYLATAATGIDSWAWARRQALRSGETAADLPYGYLGLVRQQNHAYAYTVHRICGGGPLRDRSALASTTGTSYSSFQNNVPITLSQDVTTLRGYFDCADCLVRIQLDDGVTTVNSSVLTETVRAQNSITLTIGGAIDRSACWLRIQWQKNATTGLMYSYQVVEVPLTAAEVP